MIVRMILDTANINISFMYIAFRHCFGSSLQVDTITSFAQIKSDDIKMNWDKIIYCHSRLVHIIPYSINTVADEIPY
jgi:hypothetical protein